MSQNLIKFFADKNVVITGGLGFIGSTLAIKLAQADANVTIVDSMIPDFGGNLFNIEPVKNKVKIDFSDIRDSSSMDYLIRGQDYLFNLAGQVSHIDSMNDPYTDLEINVRGQLSILESCRKFNPKIKVIYASTRQFYGKAQYLPVDEKHPICPTDVNGINKFAGEQYHILYNNVYGIKTVALRMTNTYGPRQLIKHNRQGFIGWFIRQIVNNEKIKIFGDGTQIRDFNYVDDVVNALLLAGAREEANGGVFNLGGKEPISLIELVKLMISLYGSGEYEIVPFPPEKKKIDIGDFYGNFEKIKRTVGWEPEITFKEGLSKTFEYYKKYKEHYL